MRFGGPVTARPFSGLSIDGEFQSEWHRRVHKHLYGLERDMETFRDAIESKPDIEMILPNHEIPELMLEHNGHFVGIARPQTRRHAHAVDAGIKGDKKMM